MKSQEIHTQIIFFNTNMIWMIMNMTKDSDTIAYI